MSSRKVLIAAALFFAACLLTSASAKVISENTFKELGYSDFAAEEEKCSSYLFSAANLAEGEYFVISLHADFAPILDRDARVEVLINDENKGNYRANEFRDGWLRVIAERDLLGGENNLKICLKPTSASLKITLFSDSYFGKYLMPDFYRQDSLVQEVSNESPYVGEKFEVFVTARNYGSEDAVLQLSYSLKDPEEVFPYLRIVNGNLEKEITVGKCRKYTENGCTEPGTASEKYVVKPEKSIGLLLRSATIEFTNVFGEDEIIKSNRTYMKIKNPELKIDAGISSENNLVKVGESKGLMLKVHNNSPYDVYRLKAIINAGNGALSEGEINVGDLEANGWFEKQIIFTPEKAGKANVNCTIISEDYNNDELGCNGLEIIAEEKSNIWIFAAMAMLAIAIGVYIYISGRGGKPGQKIDPAKKEETKPAQ